MLPASLQHRVERLGYVSKDELLRQYQIADVFLLLSDFEAFGLPIAEALCCGVSVVMNDQKATAAVFGALPGVTLVRNDDPNGVRDAILAAIAHPPDRFTVAAAADRFAHHHTYGRKLEHVLALCR